MWFKKTSKKSKKSKKNLRIVFIAPFGLKTKGTVAARILPIAHALVGKGHHVRLIIPAWDDPPNSTNLRLKNPRLELNGEVELVFVPVGIKPLPLTIPLWLVAQTLTYKPDIIHVFKSKAYSGLAALLLNLLGREFVLDTDDWEGWGGYNDVNPYSFLQKQLFAWQERDLARRATGISVASRTLQSQAWGFGVKPEQVVYLPNGISKAKYEIPPNSSKWREKLELSDDAIVLLAYTRFAEFKPSRLLDIVNLVLTKLEPALAARIRLLVVGGGFFGEEQAFSQLVNGYGLAAKVVMTGTVAPDDIAALLDCGDVALYPFDDNLINRARCSAKFLDLIRAGKPLVSETVGELREYLQNGQGGWLVQPYDHVAFADAVVKLVMRSDQERVEFARPAWERLNSIYIWEKLIEGLEKLYRS